MPTVRTLLSIIIRPRETRTWQKEEVPPRSGVLEELSAGLGIKKGERGQRGGKGPRQGVGIKGEGGIISRYHSYARIAGVWLPTLSSVGGQFTSQTIDDIVAWVAKRKTARVPSPRRPQHPRARTFLGKMYDAVLTMS